MKKILATISLSLICLISFAQEPGNNLGKSLSSMRYQFPDLQYGWSEEGKDFYVHFEKDEYHKYTYYFVVERSKVVSETLMVEATGVIPHADYIFFLTMVKRFYTGGNWKMCDVDNSILHAASVFNSQYKIEWANKFSAELDYSNFLIYLKYNPQEKLTSISYFPR